jgi:hypothetical protein
MYVALYPKVIILSVFLLSSLYCAPTKQEAVKTDESTQKISKTDTAVSGPFDLTGTWVLTEIWTGGYERETKAIRTIEITQQGDTIHMVNVKKIDGILVR